MEKDVKNFIMEKIYECKGDLNKLERTLSDYFNVPLEDIHTNIRITIPMPDDMIKKEDDTVNVNLTLKVDKDEEMLDEEDLFYAKEDGVYEGKLEVARNLFESGTMNFEEISKITGLSIDDLNHM